MDYGGIMDGQSLVQHVASPDDKIKALASAVLIITQALQSPMGGHAVKEVVQTLTDCGLIEKE